MSFVDLIDNDQIAEATAGINDTLKNIVDSDPRVQAFSQKLNDMYAMSNMLEACKYMKDEEEKDDDKDEEDEDEDEDEE